MRLTRWEPQSHEMNSLREQMNRFLESFGSPQFSWPVFAFAYPPLNVWDDDNNVYVEAELPGLKREDLDLSVREGNELVLQGERKPAEVQGTWHRRERGFGKFQRSVTLPVPVDQDKVEARFEQGVLHVVLPKKEQARTRRIPVRGE